jgi:uncharacterized protein YggU (UPF0235/DUF167 family)
MKINIHIKPNSKKGPLVEVGDDGLIVYVREVAVDNRANEALVKLLAKHYGVPKTRIKIIRGHTSRRKAVEII